MDIYMDLLICMHLPRRTAARGGRVTAARVSVSPAAHRRAGRPRARASLPRSLGQACPAPRPCSSPSLHTPGRGCRRLQGQSCYASSPQNQWKSMGFRRDIREKCPADCALAAWSKECPMARLAHPRSVSCTSGCRIRKEKREDSPSVSRAPPRHLLTSYSPSGSSWSGTAYPCTPATSPPSS